MQNLNLQKSIEYIKKKEYKIFKVDQTILIFKVLIIYLIMFKKNKINFCSSFIIYKFYFVYFILQIFIELLYMNNEDSIFLNF